MLIIIEGCDGTGKTTLANMLKPLLGAEIVHCTTQTPNTYGFFNNIIYAAQKKHIIVDRFCYSQFVYQEEEDRPLALHEIYPLDGDRRFVENSYESLARLEIDMLQADTKLIYVSADTETIHRRLSARDSEIPLDNFTIEDIKAKYEDLWKRTLIQPIRYVT